MKMDISPNFTPRSQQLIVESKLLAVSLNHKEVTADHLLISVLRSDGGFIREFINGFGLSADKFVEFIITYSSLDKRDQEITGCSYAASFKEALTESHTFSTKLGHSYIGVEHLFFVLINLTESSSSNFFYSENISPSQIMETFLLGLRAQELVRETKKAAVTESMLDRLRSRPTPQPRATALESFCVSLNKLAQEGSLSKIIGKDLEIERMCEILGRKIKNNPLLIGEPGVGKTAIAEGLASRHYWPSVPPMKKLFYLLTKRTP